MESHINLDDRFDPDQPLNETVWSLFDVETTGLNPAYGHRVCEVACLCLRDGEEIDRFDSLVDPGRDISPGAFRVNRITAGMLAGAPPFEAVAGPLLARMEGAVLVAHNAPFDLGFLAAELDLAGSPPPEGPVIDTLTLARRTYSLPSYSLSAVVRALAVDVEPSHRAMADVEAMRGVLEQLLWDLDRRWGVTTLGGLLTFQGGSIPYPTARALPLPPPLAEALSSQGQVLMRYVDARGAESERLVRPLSVRESGGNLYLRAHCYRADALRTFRLDRIMELSVSD